MTVEQDLKLRQISDGLSRPETTKEDIITVFLALQHQNFILSNSLMNLVKQWPKTPPTSTDQNTTNEDQSRPGILFGIKI